MLKTRDLEQEALTLFDARGLAIDKEGRIWRTHLLHGCGPHIKEKRKTRIPKRRAEGTHHKVTYSTGRVKSGYLTLQLKSGAKRYTLLAHRVVWVNLHGPIPQGFWINHKDGNMRNNHPDNLELSTPSENRKHALKTGLSVTVFGDKVGGSKLSNANCAKIRKMWDTGGYSQQFLADRFGISQATTSKIVLRQIRTRELLA